jgi:hypothetical protein
MAQAVALLIVVAVVYRGAESYLQWSGLALLAEAIPLMLLYIVLEGLGRFVRDAAMAALMLQRDARRSVVLRQGVVLAGVGLIAGLDLTTAIALLSVEVIASSVATVAALAALFRGAPQGSTRDVEAGADWRAPLVSEQYAVATRMYLAHLLTLSYSPLVLVQLVQRFIGPDAAAIFGFARILHDQLARYLPAMLFFSLLRPRLMADFVRGGVLELSRNVNLAGKLNLFVLFPCVIAAALSGASLVTVLSSWKFDDSGFVLAGFFLALVPFSQRQLLESAAVATNLAWLCVAGALVSSMVLPLALTLGLRDADMWAFIAIIGLGHLIFDAVVTIGLSLCVDCRLDLPGYGKLGLCFVVSVVLGGLLLQGLDWLPVQAVSVWWGGPLASLAAISVYFAMARLLRPFTDNERDRINAMARRRVFVW